MLNNWKINIFITVVLWTVANLFLKQTAGNVHWQISTFFWMFGSFISSIICSFILRKHWQKPNKPYIASSVCGVICAISIGVASILYQICDASKIAPIMGLATPLSGVVCLLIFKEKITPKIILGLIFASLCVYLLG